MTFCKGAIQIIRDTLGGRGGVSKNVKQSDFQQSDFQQSDFWQSDLWTSDFWPREFWQSDFWQNDFRLNDFWWSNFRQSDFQQSDFWRSDFWQSDQSPNILTWHQKCQSVNRQQIAFQGSDLFFSLPPKQKLFVVLSKIIFSVMSDKWISTSRQ